MVIGRARPLQGCNHVATHRACPDSDHLQKPAQPVAGILHLGLVYETTGQIIEIICHSEFQS